MTFKVEVKCTKIVASLSNFSEFLHIFISSENEKRAEI